MDLPPSPKKEFPSFVDNGEEKQKENIPDQRARSGSGSKKNIFSRFPLLRTNSEERATTTETDGRDGTSFTDTALGAAGQKRTRKRKGSLRKVALLGGRDRKGSDVKKSPLSSPGSEKDRSIPHVNEHEPQPGPNDNIQRTALPIPRWPAQRTSVASITSSAPSIEPASSAASITSPTAPTDASLTDDDESMSFPRLQLDGHRMIPSSGHDSYFPPADQLPRRRLSRKASPLVEPEAVPMSPGIEVEWDYSETAYWGYIILIVTWLVFVIGMGSCFGVWSWA